MLPTRCRRLVVAIVACCGLASGARAQSATTARPVEVSGAANVNTKGISLVPALTLGRPSAIFDLAVRKGDLSFLWNIGATYAFRVR